MKRFRALLAAAVTAVLFAAGAPPAHAAPTGPDHLLAPAAFVSVYETVFMLSGCPAPMGAAANPLNGTDAAIFDLAGGSSATLTWTPMVNLAPVTGGGLVASFYTASCLRIFAPAFSTTPGPWTISAPPGARWMVITAHFAAGVFFT